MVPAETGESTGKRVLVTGLGTFWGGLVAKELEADPSVDVIIGLDTVGPTIELERTEYVRTDANYSILNRIVRATQVDTIVHTFLVVDSTSETQKSMHETNVIGTMNLFAAASAPESSVRHVIVKSSAFVYGTDAQDPNCFSEDSQRSRRPDTKVEQSLEQVEGYVRDYAMDNPHVVVTLLRYANVIGPRISTPLSRALTRPLVPCLGGFDPRFQWVHEDDVVRSILFAVDHELAGVYNVAGDGMIPWSEAAAICHRRRYPLPPFGAELLSWPLRLFGGVDLPEEFLGLLRYGRGVDNSRLKRAGFEYLYTSAGALEAFTRATNLRKVVGDQEPAYRYERDVEQFFRHSPAVLRDL